MQATYDALPEHVRSEFAEEDLDVKGKGVMRTYIMDAKEYLMRQACRPWS